MDNYWYIKSTKELATKNSSRTKYKTDSRRLKFCKECQMVWEKCHADNTHYRYKDFPTIGLTRMKCTFCEK
tara:strand:- start:473 stop:685 length:213 start_codon:yes stop_codon:yes gene_type:complete